MIGIKERRASILTLPVADCVTSSYTALMAIKELTFIEPLLCASHCFNCFTCVKLSEPLSP